MRRRFDAATYSWLSHEPYKDSAGTTAMSVESYFDCNKSWTRYKRLHAPLLAHEQTHFNITELYARKTRKALAEYMAEGDLKELRLYDLQWICQKKRYQLRRCQRRYDRQTKHSRRRKEQQKWNADINAQLEALKDFGN